jgi:Phage protein (N4 Gp49/phage Sf6 gene 66) family
MHSETLKATDDYSAKGATAPRVSLDDMKAKIAGESYFTIGAALAAMNMPVSPATDLLTVCILEMQNGFTIIGKSAPASPENFDADKGKRFAYEDAIKQLWPLEGYALREKLVA